MTPDILAPLAYTPLHPRYEPAGVGRGAGQPRSPGPAAAPRRRTTSTPRPGLVVG